TPRWAAARRSRPCACCCRWPAPPRAAAASWTSSAPLWPRCRTALCRRSRRPGS
ncbi:unnamed protein product, partial [Prorocentrum cordatum]